jgi:molybdopterin molybdotransferase
MRSPEQAILEILAHTVSPGEGREVSLLQASGRVLAADVVSDVDLPPFEKSAMDGWAVRAADFEGVDPEIGLELDIAGESRAGCSFEGSLPPRSCVLITTGAELPRACDAVVVVEKSREGEKGVRLFDRPRVGQHVCHRGEDLRIAAPVFRAPRRLSPTDLSVLGAVGCDPVLVRRRPRVAVLTTGDELVPPDEFPGAGQIRETNTLHLAALALRAGARVEVLERLRDRSDELEAGFARALAGADVVVTTGGVSMGKYDLVAGAFEALGVREIFHKVAIKPGKPIWFGLHEEGGRRVLVFGLPGNPVSCLLDFEVFVRPALAKLEGAPEEEWQPRLRRGRWMGEARGGNPREQNLPVRVHQGEDGIELLEPLRWSSSADIVGLAEADGFARLPAEQGIETGAMTLWRPLR